MKKINFLKTFILCSLLTISGLITMSIAPKAPTGGGGGGTTNVPDKSMTIILDAMGSLPRPANIRNFPCPAFPFLGMGGGSPATDLNDSPFTKFYCVVTVTKLNTTSWGTNGKKTTIWNTNSTQKAISVPGSGSYRITVDYYEQKNQYWSDTVYMARGKWTSESTFSSGYSSTYGFRIFTYVQRLF